jgi:hypothetical protein
LFTFSIGENSVLQLNGGTFFIPDSDSTGRILGGIQANISDMALDASALVTDKPYRLTIAFQSWNDFSRHDVTSHEVNLVVTAVQNMFYISSDRIVVPAKSPVVLGDGPFITVNFLKGQRGSEPLIGWVVEAQQGDRQWSEKISTSGVMLSGVKLLPTILRSPIRPMRNRSLMWPISPSVGANLGSSTTTSFGKPVCKGSRGSSSVVFTFPTVYSFLSIFSFREKMESPGIERQSFGCREMAVRIRPLG